MVPHDGQCGNVGKISRVERAVCVGDQGGNHTTPRKQIAYKGFFFRKTGVSFDEKHEPGNQIDLARKIGRVGQVRGQAGFPACLRGRPIFKRVKGMTSCQITSARNSGLRDGFGAFRDVCAWFIGNMAYLSHCTVMCRICVVYFGCK